METLRPALQRVYMTRASAYRDALKSFIGGYQEGIQEVMEKKEKEIKSQQEEDNNTPQKSTWWLWTEAYLFSSFFARINNPEVLYSFRYSLAICSSLYEQAVTSNFAFTKWGSNICFDLVQTRLFPVPPLVSLEIGLWKII